MKILLVNTHSTRNSGDTGIVIAQVELLRKVFPGASISLTSRTPETDRPFFSRFDVTILPCIVPAPCVYEKRFTRIVRVTTNLLKLSGKIRLIASIRSSDLVISSGGGYFYSNKRFLPGLSFIQNILHVKIAQCMKKPVLFFPQSFGPFRNPLAFALVRNIIQSPCTAAVFIREPRSLDLLRGLPPEATGKTELCPDLALYLRNPHSHDSTSALNDLPRPLVILTLRPWEFPEAENRNEKTEKQSRYLSALVTVCTAIHHRLGGSVAIYPQVRSSYAPEDDQAISKKFFAMLRPEIPETHRQLLAIPESAHPREIIGMLSRADLIIGTRFHSALFALVAATPIVVLSYQPKAEGIMEMMGLSEYLMDIAAVDPDLLFAKVVRILQNPEKLRNRITDKVNSARDEIEKKISHRLRTVVSGPE